VLELIRSPAWHERLLRRQEGLAGIIHRPTGALALRMLFSASGGLSTPGNVCSNKTGFGTIFPF
jgi:hypothetical protein